MTKIEGSIAVRLSGLPSSKEGRVGTINAQNGDWSFSNSSTWAEHILLWEAKTVIFWCLTLTLSHTLAHVVSGKGSGIHFYSLNKNEGDPETSIPQQHDAGRKAPYLGQWSL